MVEVDLNKREFLSLLSLIGFGAPRIKREESPWKFPSLISKRTLKKKKERENRERKITRCKFK